MGVPQARERTFFIARRKDLSLKKIEFDFKESIIGSGRAIAGAGGIRPKLTPAFAKWWRLCEPGKAFSSVHPKKSFFNCFKLNPNKPANTQIATNASVQSLWDEPETLSGPECARIQAFPDDYNFMDNMAKYVCGMSVPPFMTQRVALEIAKLLGVTPRARKTSDTSL